MDNLPWLPLEKVLSYLDLDELLRLRAVCRNWCACIDNLKATTLFYSDQKRGRIYKKYRPVDRFDRNFIASSKFELFFSRFTKSIFSNLEHLRIYSLTQEDGSLFSQTLNSFGQLRKLDLIGVDLVSDFDFQLNLPNLKSIRIECLWRVSKLTILESPKLSEIQLYSRPIRLEIVHTESVERILIDHTEYLDMEKFQNLKYLYCFELESNASFLPKLEQLKEIHLSFQGLRETLRQKETYWLRNLKVYFCGLPLNNLTDLDGFLDDYDDFDYYYISLTKERFSRYVENHSRLADEIHAFRFLEYSEIDAAISSGVPIDFWKRFVNLSMILVEKPIHSKAIPRFLQFLKDVENIASLSFKNSQPQDLFDRLPDHCALQELTISGNEHLDLEFLFRLKDLTKISISHRIKSDFLRRLLREFEFLSEFSFINRFGSYVQVKPQPSQGFEVSGAVFSDLNKAIEAMNFGEPSAAKTKSNPRKANRKRF